MDELTQREQSILTEARERIGKWGMQADISASKQELAALALKLAGWVGNAEDNLRDAAEYRAENERLREQLATANRQLGAAKARESKLRQQLSQQEK